MSRGLGKAGREILETIAEYGGVVSLSTLLPEGKWTSAKKAIHNALRRLETKGFIAYQYKGWWRFPYKGLPDTAYKNDGHKNPFVYALNCPTAWHNSTYRLRHIMR